MKVEANKSFDRHAENGHAQWHYRLQPGEVADQRDREPFYVESKDNLHGCYAKIDPAPSR